VKAMSCKAPQRGEAEPAFTAGHDRTEVDRHPTTAGAGD
jgi:hypothetical protein